MASPLQDLITQVTNLAVDIGNALRIRGFKGGGTAGQVPVKVDGNDFNWSWGNPTVGSASWNALSDRDTANLPGTNGPLIAALNEKQPVSSILTNTTASFTTAINTRLANTSGVNTGDQVNITGNAGTVTNIGNLTGPVTSVNRVTSIGAGAITNSMLANTAVANLSGINTGDQTNIPGNAGTVTTINGRLSAGTNVTLSGAGTAASPYVISASGGGGGSSVWGGITGTLADQTDLQTALNGKLSVSSAASTYQPLSSVLTGTTASYTTAIDARLANTSGTNTGDETTSTIKSKLGISTLTGTNTGDQDLSGLATTSALTSGLDGKSGVWELKSAESFSVVANGRYSCSGSCTTALPTSGIANGTTVEFFIKNSSSLTVTGYGTFTTSPFPYVFVYAGLGLWFLNSNGVLPVANGGTGATTAAAARNNLLAATKREYKTANFTAEAYGRYVVSSGGTVVVSNPTTGVLGDPFEVVIAAGSATINGVTYAASRFPIDVICSVAGTPGTWTTAPATVTGTLTATTFSGAGTSLTGTAASLTAGNATLAAGLSLSGGGTVTGASGAVTIAASGTNQNVNLTPSGLGNVVASNLIFSAGFRANSGNGFFAALDGSYTAGGRLQSFVDGTFRLANAAGSSGVYLDFATNGTLKLSNLSNTAGTGNLDIGGTLAVTGSSTLTGGATFGTSATKATTRADLDVPQKTVNFTANMGWPANLYKSITVTATGCTPSSEVTVDWRNAPVTAENEPEMDSLQFRAIPGTDSFTLIVTPERNEAIGGTLLLKYQITN